jgi:dipeptidyl-peptidase-3
MLEHLPPTHADDPAPRASFAGNRIVLRQVSPESEPIYDFILALHRTAGDDWKALADKAGVDEQGLSAFLQYAAQFLGNSGNYKSFGDSKFLPRCDESVFASLASTSPEAEKHYKATNGAIFASDKQGLLHLGFPDEGHLTTYYPDSPEITKDEVGAVSKWMEDKGLLPENTRLRKTKAGVFELLIASATTSVPDKGGDIGKDTEYVISEGPLAGKTVKLVYGDYAKEMDAIARFIKKAADNAENETQQKMHLAYNESFDAGSLLAFKDSQRHWIRDQGPMVECNIGFIETYRDPAGVRGEWEGFAAVVNRMLSVPGAITGFVITC